MIVVLETNALIDLLHSNIRRIGPDYRFHTITGDPDDDAFAECAIAAGADYIVTSDPHFDALIGSGYKPQPITPEGFVPYLTAPGNP